MKKKLLSLFVFISILYCSSSYCYDKTNLKTGTILTDDYGVFSSSGAPKRVYNVKLRHSPDFRWQCFSRHKITVRLTELGNSEDLENKKENYSLIEISAADSVGITHEYVMRRAREISEYQQLFNIWLSLMKGEKHVCIAGSFVEKEDEKRYLWVFEKIKSKKGCYSYFQDENCHYEAT